MTTCRQAGRGILLGVLIAAAASCSANKRPSKMETMLANAAKDVAIPIQATNLQNPFPANPETIERGQQVYQQSCALCHGADGHSATELGRGMYPPAMDLTSPHVQHWSDGDLFWIIQNGIRLTGMPAWNGAISEEDMWKLARFIHALPQISAAGAVQSTPPLKQADLIGTAKRSIARKAASPATAWMEKAQNWVLISPMRATGVDPMNGSSDTLRILRPTPPAPSCHHSKT